MRKKDIEDLVRDYMKVWTAGKIKRLDKLASKRLTVHYSHYRDKLNLDAFRESLLETHRQFPDMKLKITRITAGENLAFVEWIYTATHTEGELFGKPAEGKKVKVAGMSRIEVRDGLVLKETGIADNLALVVQIGAVMKE